VVASTAKVPKEMDGCRKQMVEFELCLTSPPPVFMHAVHALPSANNNSKFPQAVQVVADVQVVQAVVRAEIIEQGVQVIAVESITRDLFVAQLETHVAPPPAENRRYIPLAHFTQVVVFEHCEQPMLHVIEHVPSSPILKPEEQEVHFLPSLLHAAQFAIVGQVSQAPLV